MGSGRCFRSWRRTKSRKTRQRKPAGANQTEAVEFTILPGTTSIVLRLGYMRSYARGADTQRFRPANILQVAQVQNDPA